MARSKWRSSNVVKMITLTELRGDQSLTLSAANTLTSKLYTREIHWQWILSTLKTTRCRSAMTIWASLLVQPPPDLKTSSRYWLLLSVAATAAAAGSPTHDPAHSASSSIYSAKCARKHNINRMIENKQWRATSKANAHLSWSPE